MRQRKLAMLASPLNLAHQFFWQWTQETKRALLPFYVYIVDDFETQQKLVFYCFFLPLASYNKKQSKCLYKYKYNINVIFVFHEHVWFLLRVYWC